MRANVVDFSLRADGDAAALSARAARDAHVWLPAQGALVRVEVADIRRVTAERDYCRIVTTGRSYLLRITLNHMAVILGRGFVRIHRSTILAIEEVSSLRYVRGRAWIAVDRRGAAHAVGRSYLRAARAALGVAPIRPPAAPTQPGAVRPAASSRA